MPVSGGAKKSRTGAKRKPAMKKKKTAVKKKTAAKRVIRRGGAHTMEYYKKKAKALGIPLSKTGKTRTKAQLQRAISYRSRK